MLDKDELRFTYQSDKKYDFAGQVAERKNIIGVSQTHNKFIKERLKRRLLEKFEQESVCYVYEPKLDINGHKSETSVDFFLDYTGIPIIAHHQPIDERRFNHDEMESLSLAIESDVLLIFPCGRFTAQCFYTEEVEIDNRRYVSVMGERVYLDNAQPTFETRRRTKLCTDVSLSICDKCNKPYITSAGFFTGCKSCGNTEIPQRSWHSADGLFSEPKLNIKEEEQPNGKHRRK